MLEYTALYKLYKLSLCNIYLLLINNNDNTCIEFSIIVLL